MKHCWFCGDEVSERDWDEIGYRRVYVCAAERCQRETRDAARGVVEEAAYDAQADHYERYW